MRRLFVLGLVAVTWGYGTPCRAQFSSCPGGVCLPSEGSSTVRASVRSRSGPGGGGLLSGLGRALLGSRRGGGASAYGSTYGAAYGAYGAPQAFGAAYAAPQTFGAAYAAPQTFGAVEAFGGGGSCYSSGGAAPMSYSPYSVQPPATYSTPQSFLGDEDYELVPIGRTPAARPARVRMAARVVSVRVLPTYVVRPKRPETIVAERDRPRAATPERRPTAVAVRPDPPVEQMAGGDLKLPPAKAWGISGSHVSPRGGLQVQDQF